MNKKILKIRLEYNKWIIKICEKRIEKSKEKVINTILPKIYGKEVTK